MLALRQGRFSTTHMVTGFDSHSPVFVIMARLGIVLTEVAKLHFNWSADKMKKFPSSGVKDI